MGAMIRTALARGAALTAVLAAPGAAGTITPFPASLAPSVVATDVDSTFTVVLQADSGAAEFNAYEVTIRFDPSVLEFESVTQGALMLSGCGNAFHVTSMTDSSVTYSHSLLCGGVSLDGPGPLSQYEFRAVGNGVSPLEIVSSPDSSFFDAGLFVSPLHPTFPRQVVFTDATVVVGPDPTASPLRPGARSDVYLQVSPNPVRGSGEIRFGLARAGSARLEILDVAGRRVFSRAWPALGSGTHRTVWSARDGSGSRLPGGVYLVRLTDSDGSRSAKITLIR